jgi:flagellar basal-body rod protein FlgG
MHDALYIGAAGMRAHQSHVDSIAHNVANVNTTGFRRQTVSFSAVTAALAQAGVDPAEIVAAAVPARGAGTLAHIGVSIRAGELRQTGEPLDVAIDGLGFLEVLRADGTPAYTRAGALALNADGMLTLADGTPLAAHVSIAPDATSVRIDADGRVWSAVADDAEPVEAGRIELVSFPNVGALQAVGSNLFVATEEAGQPQIAAPGEGGLGLIRQGFLESSNVQLVDELVALMLAQRAFELNSRVVQAADQMLQITNSLYR